LKVNAEPARNARAAIAARLDALPVTPLHWAILIVCALGLLFDVVEAGLSNALSAVFSAAPYRVPPFDLSLLLASVFAGGAIGAPLLGWFADRYGRRLALGTALFVMAGTSLLAAASTDITWLTVCRALSGFVLGAYPPLMAAYLSDVLPPARRGRMIMIGAAIGFLGAPAVIFLMRWLTPLAPFGYEGWRWTLAIGAIGAALIALCFRLLPESPRWLAAAGRHADATAACLRFERAAGVDHAPPPLAAHADAARTDVDTARFWSSAGRRYRGRAGLMAALYLLSPWATIGFPLLSGAVLVEKGFRVADSLLYLGISMFGPATGALAASCGFDRVERRTALILSAGIMAASGLAFAATDLPLPLTLLGVAFNLVGAVYVASLSIYDAELFPTAMRASVSSTTWAVNRVASALLPLALLPLLRSAGALAMFSVITAALVLSIMLLAALGPRGFARRAVE
jgi:putative MFS transporter